MKPRNQTLAPTATAARASAPSLPAITASANCIPAIERLLTISGAARINMAFVSVYQPAEDANLVIRVLVVHAARYFAGSVYLQSIAAIAGIPPGPIVKLGPATPASGGDDVARWPGDQDRRRWGFANSVLPRPHQLCQLFQPGHDDGGTG